MALFFALKGLAMIYRAAQTIEYHVGGIFGAVGTPHLGDLNRQIAEDFKYDDVGEVLVDLAGLGAGGAAAKAGIKPAILATLAARRVVQERLGAVTKTFLGIIPKPFLPVAEAAGALGEEVLDMVGSAIDVGSSLLAISSGFYQNAPNLVRDTFGFIKAAFEVYSEGSAIISVYVEGFQKQFGTAEGLVAATAAAVDAFLFPFAEQKERAGATQRAVAAVNEAIGSFLLDLAHGFADLTNPLLHFHRPEDPGPTALEEAEARVEVWHRERAARQEETQKQWEEFGEAQRESLAPFDPEFSFVRTVIGPGQLLTTAGLPLPRLTDRLMPTFTPFVRELSKRMPARFRRTRIPVGFFREIIQELKSG